ncbi:type VI secretion system contractile sheath small subunit [Pantoea agglomerans]|uniref:type VI secretion system contractile sheath small subunit n=1 Tax=Enterobacter agglomerans TaxID=549 RepID=UPI00301D270B
MSDKLRLSKGSGQKFIARNRAPRVQIEYDVELYGSERKIQIPFIMGVMADLSGEFIEKKTDLLSRKFLEIDIDNFDERMKSIKPTLSFQVDNTLTGEGLLNVDLSFTSLNDFSPDKIAENLAPLKMLLDSRTQLANLLSYMDGKNRAEGLINSLLNTPKLQKMLLQKDEISALNDDDENINNFGEMNDE